MYINHTWILWLSEPFPMEVTTFQCVFWGVGWDILVTYHAEVHTVRNSTEKMCLYKYIHTDNAFKYRHIIRI